MDDKCGNNFVLAPFPQRNCGFVYRVQAANRNTTLNITNTGTIKLQPTDFYEQYIAEKTTMITVSSDFPVLVAEYMTSRGYGHDCGANGDPSMTIVPYVESYYTNVTFPVVRMTHPYHTRHYFISILAECSYVDDILFDETTSVSDWTRLSTPDQTMCAIHSDNIPTGVHSVTSRDPTVTFSVIVILTCFNCEIGFVYQAGVTCLGKSQCVKVYRQLLHDFISSNESLLFQHFFNLITLF